MRISQNVIDEVLNRSDIVEIIGRDLKLKRSGSNYFACCPFHQEKTPSFSINPIKQAYYCFGCHESGNVISFIMKYYGLDFIEAVKHLADRGGIYIASDNESLDKEELNKQKKYRQNLNDVIKIAVSYYKNNLTIYNVATGYLQQRGLTNEVVSLFELGYANNNLKSQFPNYAANQLLEQAGLIIKKEGATYDRFRERLIFPIKNIKGNVIAFGGRIIGQGEPKYLNSPETILFNKSVELYGLFESKRAISDEGKAIVVEGYIDVITLHQYHITNVVATMGTSVTEEHIKRLFRICDSIYFCFDGDLAGQKAAWKALERSICLINDVKNTYFLFLPEEHDPDSYLRMYGRNYFIANLQEKSLSLADFLFSQLSKEVKINTYDGRAKLISLTKPYINQIKSIALQVMLKKQLADIIGLDINIVEGILTNKTRINFTSLKSSLPLVLPLKVNLIKKIITASLKEPNLTRSIVLPSNKSDYEANIVNLFRMIEYLSENCTNFEEIDINLLNQLASFPNINLITLYEEIKFEKLNYKNIPSINKEEYIKSFNNLLIKKAKRLSKI